jgi:malate synthase
MKDTIDVNGVDIVAPLLPGFETILSPDALNFFATIERRFGPRRLELLTERRKAQAGFDAGVRPTFLSATNDLRAAEWSVNPVPEELLDRRVEITGPVDRKMVINGLNADAKVFMADFEDSSAPTWGNMIHGQINLRDAARGTIEYQSPAGKYYALNSKPAVLMVRPRGLHLDERHILVDGRPASGALLDFALFFFHNAHALIKRGTGPYFYLPKLEGHLEARLWNDVFLFAQEALAIPHGTIKATVLIETITAAFEMDEILYELREHSAGLNCGRWDYIFSVIKKFRRHGEFVLPDRGLVTMTAHFLRSYSQLLIKTCHRRGAHAMGGMAAQIPIKNDEERNRAALQKVHDDKLREVTDGHDGTWVAHPGLIPVARAVFDEHMPGANQLERARTDVTVTAEDLLRMPSPEGHITEAGLRNNARVSVEYLAAWLNGNGCVPINFLMEDTATAEIARTQLWQWVHHAEGVLDDGRKITLELVRQIFAEELKAIREDVGDAAFRAGSFEQAARLLDTLITNIELEEFLTVPAYALLHTGGTHG